MKAIGITQAGGPEVLHVIDLPDPEAGPGEILLKVNATAVSPIDAMTRARAASDTVTVPGMDAVGDVVAIGPDTHTDLKVGDRAMGIVLPSGTHGGYAQLLALPAESVVATPANLDDAEAATLPMNSLTARRALDLLDLRPGATVAVTGAAGIMGGYAVQEAKADGLHVVVDAKESDVDLLRGLGADVVVPRSEDFAAAVLNAVPDGVDGVVDGAILEAALTPALKDGGKVATLHGYKADAERGISFVPVSVADYAREHERLAALAKLAEEGKLTPRVAQRLPKEQAPAAHRLLEAGGQRGRIVLDL